MERGYDGARQGRKSGGAGRAPNGDTLSEIGSKRL
jgi:hypothetical protein